MTPSATKAANNTKQMSAERGEVLERRAGAVVPDRDRVDVDARDDEVADRDA